MQFARRFCAGLTTFCFLVLGMAAPANAAVIGTDAYLAATDRAERIAHIQATLARDDVRSQLVTLGVDPEQATARAASLSEQELATVAQHLDELPAGGDLLAVIGIVFVVLLILESTGVTDVFKKI